MSKISALDFAKNVEQNRQSLINHCLENGKSVSSTASLNEVVTTNNTIENGQNGFKVEFRDIDGTLLAPVQYVQAGGSATVPSTNPTFDSDYLEFDYWAVSGGDSLTNITRNTLVMPQYKTKLDSNLGQRPTYLVCYFDSNQLSPTLQIGNTHTNAYVDWGDGTAAEQITTFTIQHTYASEGRYVITLYGDSYTVGGSSGGGIFTTNSYSKSLLKAYLGGNYTPPNGGTYMFVNCSSLTNIVLITHSNFNNLTMSFQNCYSLISIVIPSGTTNIGQNCFQYCYSLKNIIIPSSVTVFGSNVFNFCYSLKNIIIPNNVTTITSGAFYITGLFEITIPSSVTSFGETAFASCSALKNIIISNGVTSIGNGAFQSCSVLTEITIPSSVTSFGNNPFNSCYALKNIILYSNFDITISFQGLYLSDECLIDIANKLKDNTGLTTRTITFNKFKCYSRMNTIYLDSNGDQVPYGTAGAVSLLAFIQNKNWTVAFS